MRHVGIGSTGEVSRKAAKHGLAFARDARVFGQRKHNCSVLAVVLTNWHGRGALLLLIVLLPKSNAVHRQKDI